MKLEINRPEGCQAVAIGNVVPGKTYSEKDTGQVTLVCGNRNLSFPTPEKMAIKHPNQYAYESEGLAELASEFLCGFCVLCENNLPALRTQSE